MGIRAFGYLWVVVGGGTVNHKGHEGAQRKAFTTESTEGAEEHRDLPLTIERLVRLLQR